MSGWTSRVESPFHGDREFWASVGLSADALWALVLATARVSTAHTRPLFPNRGEWRAAERHAVAAAIPGAFTRHLRRRRED